MNIYAETDYYIAKKIGRRLDQLRESRGMTREELGAEMGISQPTLRKFLDAGEGKFFYLISALRALQALDELESFLEPTFSPIQAWKNAMGKNNYKRYHKKNAQSKTATSTTEQADVTRQDDDLEW